jgi:RND family efflux transporter MFP subunit
MIEVQNYQKYRNPNPSMLLSRYRFHYVGLLLTGMVSGLAACRSAPPPPSMGVIPVQTRVVQTTQVADVSDFNALLQSRQSIQLQPQVEGRISQILVNSGQTVTAGTPLIQIDPARQTAAVSSNLAAIQSAQAEVDNAKAVLVSLQAQRQSDLANVKMARWQSQRYASLAKAGAVSAEQARSFSMNYETAQARLNATEAQIKAQQSTINQRQQSLMQARANTQQQAVVLQYYRVTAPFTGTVGDIPPKVGDYVQTSSRLLTLTQNQPLEVYIYVPVEQVPRLRQGMPVQLLNPQGNPLGTSQIFFISPQTTNNTQTILVKALFENSANSPGGQLRADQQIQARIVWSQRPGLLVPTSAVSNLAGQNFVFVAEPGKDSKGNNQGNSQGSSNSGFVARQRPVTLGRIHGNKYQVLKGLQPGEQIITSGVQLLADGAPIKPTRSGS